MTQDAKVFESLEEAALPAGRPVALTIGTFDGVHMAHKALLREAVERAREMNGLAVALTFRNHPRAIVSPEDTPPLLTEWKEKCLYIQEQGVDIVVGLLFDKKFAATPADVFVKEVIAGKFQAKFVISGPGFHFGRGGTGNAELLRAMSAGLGYAYKRRDPVFFDGEKVSSTRIRRALADGNAALASQLLTRPHANHGSVVPGDGLGRQIGFPTANLDINEHVLIPADGVYAVRVYTPGQCVPGMMNIGWRPTVGGKDRRCEVHLIDWSRDLLGVDLRVEYVKRLRGEVKFDGLDGLKAQLAKDRKASLEALSLQ